jgi:hypothetical protein
MLQTTPIPVYTRTTLSGDYVEMWTYEKPIFIHVSGGYPISDQRKYSNEYLKKQSMLRAQQNIKRTILANWGQYSGCTTKFLTLTFADDVTERKKANIYFDRFKKRLQRRYGKLYYIAVPEKQKDIDFHGQKKQYGGSWHYHVIFFNLPYVHWKKLITLWQYGGIYIEKVHNALHCSRYIAKYLTKTARSKNEKSVYMSQGLYRAETVYGLPSYLTGDDKKLYSREYQGEYVGRVQYACWYVGNKKQKFLKNANKIKVDR